MSKLIQPAVNLPGQGKVVILAVGNRWRGDDAIGPWVADQLKTRLDKPPLCPCSLVQGVNDALGILSAWEGAELVVAIDATITGAPPGTIHHVQAADDILPKELGRCSSHGSGLAEAILLGRTLDRLPMTLTIFAVEARGFEPGVALSEPVRAAGSALLETIMQTITAFRVKESSHA